MKKCNVQGCNNMGALVKGMCRKHYKRLWRNGTLSPTKQAQDSISERLDRWTDKYGTVAYEGMSACWNWIGTKVRDGYGRISVNGKPKMAHRVSFELVNGMIPEGFFVCHKCDNPSCVNPEHMFIGSRLDNMRDKVAKGRAYTGESQSGENCGRSKLTEADVRAIRLDNRPRKIIAQQYSIHYQHVSNIKAKRSWAHI